MNDHIVRMRIEGTELNGKIVALTNFIDSNPIFKTLPEADQELLKTQLVHMKNYFDVLDERICRAYK